jgi:hypothetical protein
MRFGQEESEIVLQNLYEYWLSCFCALLNKIFLVLKKNNLKVQAAELTFT